MDVDDLNDSITSCSSQHVSGLRSCVAKTREDLKLPSSQEGTLTCESDAFNPVLVPPHGHTIPPTQNPNAEGTQVASLLNSLEPDRRKKKGSTDRGETAKLLDSALSSIDGMQIASDIFGDLT